MNAGDNNRLVSKNLTTGDRSAEQGAKHTPGPWVFGKTGDDRRLILGGEGRRYVCNIQIHQTPRNMGLLDEPEREANARLIAAAPDMLAALKDLLGSEPLIGKDGVCRCCGRDYGGPQETDDCLYDGPDSFDENCPGMNARAALSKATGAQS